MDVRGRALSGTGAERIFSIQINYKSPSIPLLKRGVSPKFFQFEFGVCEIAVEQIPFVRLMYKMWFFLIALIVSCLLWHFL